MFKFSIVCLLIAVSSIGAWHTCKDEEFCNRLRNRPADFSKYVLLEDTVVINQEEGRVQAKVKHENSEPVYDFTFESLENGIYKISLWEKPRNVSPGAQKGPIPSIPAEIQMSGGVITVKNSQLVAQIVTNNMQIVVEDLINNQVTQVNPNSNMLFDPNNGFAMSFTFKNTNRAYGIPEHGDHLVLSDTRDKDPYRMFNLDYGYYAVESQESLYGSVPVLYAHSSHHTSGVFWDNPSQTFVDITYTETDVLADFISEAGTLEVFILNGGPTFKEAVKQYVQITGTANLPPLFSMGYHQSRYSYLTQEDLETVNAKLGENDFPTDVLWLDIDYTDGKKYFTWNYTAYPDPLSMQEKLRIDGRKLVTIIDPHIKVETGYPVYDEMIAKDFHVKNADGSAFEGSCWPGLSSYVDFFNPEARTWWGDRYQFENYHNTTDIVHIWNDMNEPSVFDVEEKTMMKDLVHYPNIQHKEVHNMYGFMQTVGTHQGLLKRGNNNQRPFILTRAHYAGSQRYTAVWTGDNIATWEHLRVSISICLSEALAGISFCGADVGGFIENPTDELHQRWFQLGAWYPFFRAHSNNEGPRREPFLYPADIQARIRNAIKQRYSHLPHWYTLWYEHENVNGEPIMRPLVYQYPKESNNKNEESVFLIGKDILVAPVLYPNVSTIEVDLPGNDLWYFNYDNIDRELRALSGKVTLNVDIDSTPVFYRGGSIILRRDESRKSSAFMREDPYSLYIYLDENYEAQGNLYVDDTETFNYRNGEYAYIRFNYKEDRLHGEYIDSARCNESILLSLVYIHQPLNLRHDYQKIILTADNIEDREITFLYRENGVIVIKDLQLDMNAIGDKFQMRFL